MKRIALHFKTCGRLTQLCRWVVVEMGQGCTAHLELAPVLCPDKGVEFPHNESALK